MYKTKEGKARRLDLIFVPPEELGFGTLGWIGGKQFLRFMRAYSDDECRMHLNSHRCAAARCSVSCRMTCRTKCWGPVAAAVNTACGHDCMRLKPAGWSQGRTAGYGLCQMRAHP
jgi:hypothetical protein